MLLSVTAGAPTPEDPVVVMMTKILPPEFSDFFCGLFDKYCPRLSSTPLLEDKVLRIVLSYGHDVAVVEPELCSFMEPISLSQKDILTVDEVADIFGGFMISAEMEQLMKESSEGQLDVENLDLSMTEAGKKYMEDMERRQEEGDEDKP